MTFVVDASAATAACLSADGFDLFGGDSLISPVLMRSEVMSSVRGLEWRGEISSDLAEGALEQLWSAPSELVDSAELAVQAYALARELGWAKCYDAEYVALAVSAGVPLFTVDGRLARRVEHLVDVRMPT